MQNLLFSGKAATRLFTRLANCCKPIPGDDVFGFVTTGKGLTIHRTNCPNAAKLMANYRASRSKNKMGKE